MARLRDRDAAEDLVQEVFLRAFLRLETLKEHERFSAWLLQIARNLAASWQRESRRSSRLVPMVSADELVLEIPDQSAPSPADRLQVKEDHQQLREALWRLPQELREVVLLHYAEGLSKAEIAERTAMHPSSVYRQLDRALVLLRADLESELAAAVRPLRAPARLEKRTVSVILAAAALSPGAREALAAEAGELGVPGAPARNVPAAPVQTSASAVGGGWTKAAVAFFLSSALVAALYQLKPPVPPSTPGNTSTVPAPGSSGSRRSSEALNGRSGRVSSVSTRRPEARRAGAASSDVSAGQASAGTTVPEMMMAEVQVRDGEGNPVPEAVITADGLRPKGQVASYSWSAEGRNPYGPPPVVKTDGAGRAYVPYPRYLNRGEETSAISFLVSHPDFVALRNTSYNVEQTSDVVLERGNTVVVSAWIGDPGRRVENFEPVVPDDALVPRESWKRINGDQMMTNAVPSGIMVLYARHESPDGRLYFADPVLFDSEAGGRKEFSLELKPVATLRGRLGANVPRPVRNGRVVVNMLGRAWRSKTDMGLLHRTWDGTIREDGTFEISSLPQGAGEIIGLCDGWISAPAADARGTTDPYGMNQKFTLAETGGHVELEMQRSAAVRVRVVDETSAPVAGATVSFRPM